MQSQLSAQIIFDVHVKHFEKPVMYGFFLHSQKSWMIKTSTGSQEVQQLRQTDASFQHQKNHNAHLVFR